MAVRTAKEIIELLSAKFPEGYPDGMESIVEDISDSVGSIDKSRYVDKEMYDNLTVERDSLRNSLTDMRSKYINRFYNDYNNENDLGYVQGGEVRQDEVEEQEKIIHYEDLFE